jgi:hypothetical protein
VAVMALLGLLVSLLYVGGSLLRPRRPEAVEPGAGAAG